MHAPARLCHAVGMSEVLPTVRRETTLHLLFTHGEQAAMRTLTTDQTSYFGANVVEVAAAAGLDLRPLRRVFFKYDGEIDGVRKAESVWHMDAREDGGLNWQPVTAFSERERGWIEIAQTPPSNVPWMHAGWFASALTWLDSELAAQGWWRRGDPKVLKHWQISALWQVETTHGKVYFKAVPDFFSREVEFTPKLAQELSGAAPPVVAADVERGFLLLADAGEALSDTPDLVALMRHLAQLQQESIPLVGAWPLRDRGPEYVLAWLDNLFSDEGLLLGDEDGFSADEAARLRAQRPALEAALQRLSASPIPRTLGHGDVHGGNVVQRGEQYTLLDWSDICRLHPFMDANPAYFLPEIFESDYVEPASAVAEARDAYLAAWTDFAAPDELRQLFADALLAEELLRALGYVDGIQAAVEDKIEWHGTHLLHLRKLLALG